jgi:hypothetical protein
MKIPITPINKPSFKFAELQKITEGIRKMEQATRFEDLLKKNKNVLWIQTRPKKEMNVITSEWIW